MCIQGLCVSKGYVLVVSVLCWELYLVYHLFSVSIILGAFTCRSIYPCSDPYYGSNRGPSSSYTSDPPSRPPPSNPPADRYGASSSGEGRSSFPSSSGIGSSYSSSSGQRGYDSSGYSGPRGGGTGYGASTTSPLGRGASRSAGYSSLGPQGRGDGFTSSTQAAPKVGYSAFNASSSTQRTQPSAGGASQGYGAQDYKPGSRY